MHLKEAIVVVITSILALTVIDGQMLIAPLFQASIDVVFIGKNGRTQLNRFCQNGLDGALLNVVEHVQNDLTVTLDHTEHWRLFPGQRTASRCAFEPSAASPSSQFGDHSGTTFMPSHN